MVADRLSYIISMKTKALMQTEVLRVENAR